MLRPEELIVDNFAGGGGASTGIEDALAVLAPGRHVDVAINHDPEAIALHAANHPETRHYCQSVWKADPRDVVGEMGLGPDGKLRPVGLAWFSPDCKHFSKAKGGKPVEKKIRDLAWVVVHWAKLVKPRIIMLENVEEFRDWGPLIETADGKLIPCPLRKGLTFKRWVRELRKLGYAVEHRELRACDYGTPTIRKRLFLIARCDGQPIVWPMPTNKPAKVNEDGIVTKWAKGQGLTQRDIQTLKPWRTAAECIDWSIPCPSIFDRKKPLAEATLRRIARGIQRYVLEAKKPFIVGLAHGTHHERPGSRCHGLDEPLRTVHAGGGNFAAVEPFVVPITHIGDDRVHGGGEPMRTVTTAHRGEMAVVVPSVVGVGGRAGQSRPRGGDEPLQTFTAKADSALVAAHLTKFSENSTGTPPDEPLHTAMAGAPRHGVVAAHLTKLRTGATGSDMAEPAPTVTANSFIKRPGGSAPIGLVAATMVQTGYGEREGQAPRALDIEAPAGTAVAGGCKAALVSAFLAQHNTGVVGHDAREPVSTIVGKGCTQAAVAAHMLSLKGSDRRDRPADEPAASVCAEGTHAALVAAFMQKYYGTGGQDAAADDPMHTATAKARLGLVTVTIDGETYVIVDIGMRMLTPRELYRAQGFPDSYTIDPIYNGKPLTKTAQIRMCGNSVCPPMARTLVLANFAVREGGHLSDGPAVESEVA